MAISYGYFGPNTIKTRPRKYPRTQCTKCGMVIIGEYSHRRSGTITNCCDGCDGTPLSTFDLLRFMEEGR